MEGNYQVFRFDSSGMCLHYYCKPVLLSISMYAKPKNLFHTMETNDASSGLPELG